MKAIDWLIAAAMGGAAYVLYRQWSAQQPAGPARAIYANGGLWRGDPGKIPANVSLRSDWNQPGAPVQAEPPAGYVYDGALGTWVERNSDRVLTGIWT